MSDANGALLVAWRLEPIQACSVELGSLRRMVADEARQVFGSVLVCEGGDACDVTKADWVLLAGPGDVFVGRRSLARMRNRIEHDGHGAAVPVRVGDLPPGAAAPFHTLAGYERVEERLLAEGLDSGSRGRTDARPPSALLTRVSDLVAACGRSVVGEWLSGRLAMREIGAKVAWVDAGFCQEFVEYYGSARREIVPLLPPGARRILEVGCGRGHTGAILERELGCQVTGVELNPEAARDAAGRLHRVVQGDAVAVALAGPYDAILLLDVLEHVADAEVLLERLATLLSPGGHMILSVPNVGHYSIVQDLLAGRWDYVPIGLLCYTHVRFFTRSTLEAWLRRCGLEIVEVVAQRSELPESFLRLGRGLPTDPESLATLGFHVVARLRGL